MGEEKAEPEPRRAIAAMGAIIVHFYREREAAALVANLVEVQGLAIEHIVLVDNGSSPGSLDSEIRRVGHRPQVLTLPNLGFAAAMNAGCRAMPESVRYLLMLSHEVVLEPGCALELLHQLRESPRALVGPVLTLDGSIVWSAGGALTRVRALPRHQLRGRPVDEVPDSPVGCAWLDGAVVATSRALLSELGGLDEDYFLYVEDVDLGLRATAASAAVVVVPTARAQQSPSPRIEPYIWTRNMFLLFRKHRLWVAWVLWLCSCAAGILRDSLMPSRRRDLSRRVHAVQDGLHMVGGPPPP